MQTIKVESTDVASQGPFVVINLSEFDSKVHTLFDQADEELLAQTVVGIPGGLASYSGPSFADIENARTELTARHSDLEAEAERQREQADVLEAERKRLAELGAQLEASIKAQADAAAATATASTTGLTKPETAAPKGAKKQAE